MKYIEAFIVVMIVALLLFPIVLIGVVICMLIEIISVIQEMFSDVAYSKGIVIEVILWYLGSLKECWVEMTKERTIDD